MIFQHSCTECDSIMRVNINSLEIVASEPSENGIVTYKGEAELTCPVQKCKTLNFIEHTWMYNSETDESKSV
ncbi:hypothetical protein NM06_01645 [Vibrio sinaloensis]|uniref:Uncharacterized protein n=1 Tax=Photobacterium sp. (strain ATCC 43367) TaxID=379097 RepID=A0A0A5I485_PHOS4|nr:hypothetical protein NM06_01645 [Vibrio sinaloensis]